MEKIQYPKFLVGSFIFDSNNRLFLRTTPDQGDRYTCINAKVEWGKKIEETIVDSVLYKTNLKVENFEFIGLTNGLDIKVQNSLEPVHMIFADYKVHVSNIDDFKQESDRKYKWLKPEEWLKLDDDEFAPYIKEIIQKLV